MSNTSPLSRLRAQLLLNDCELLSRRWPGWDGVLRMRCKRGHRFEKLAKNVSQAPSCPECRRDPLPELRELARKRGGECLEKRYRPKTKLSWRCAKGHEWRTLPTYVRGGSWCPRCAGKVTTIDDLREAAARHSGECLSSRYHATHKLLWRCARGHEWRTTWAHVRDGSWCPKCAWGTRSLEDMQALAASHGGRCLSKRYWGVRQYVLWECQAGHVWKAQANEVTRGRWCAQCFFDTMRGTIEDMRAVALSRGGDCLSKIYTNSTTPLLWKCKEGHTWWAEPSRVKYGDWCALCGGTARLTIEQMQSIARTRGGECLSESYVNGATKLTWKCAEGHVWQARPLDVKNKASWCARCARKSRSRR